MFVKKKIMFLVLLLLGFTLSALQPVLAAEANKPDIEVTLNVGTSNLDITDFSDNLKSVLFDSYGITNDRVKVTKAGSTNVDSENNFLWTIYDHVYSNDYPTDGSVPADWSVNHETYQPYFYYKENYPIDETSLFTDVSYEDESLEACYNRSKHIYPKDGDIYFLGYSNPGYKDFMLYPDLNTGEKTIQFTVYEGAVDTHTLEGAGFLFNTSIVNNKINGYLVFYDYANYEGIKILLYKLTDVDAYDFHQAANEDSIHDMDSLDGVELLGEEDSLSTERSRNIRIKVTNESLKFYEDGIAIYDTTDPESDISIEDTGSGGFGPLVSYESHGCESLSYFIFKNVTMETTQQMSFMDMLDSLEWGDNTKRFLVNLDDNGIPAFSDSDSSSQIISKMRSDKINYIGWGLNNIVEGVSPSVYNKDQARDIIYRNASKGIFINQEDTEYDTYDKGINAIAKYINDGFRVSTSSSGGSHRQIDTDIVTFIDMTNHWAKADVERISLHKIIKGYPDKTFGPDKFVTRAEFAVMLARVLEIAKLNKTEGLNYSFSDMSSNDWFYEAVNQLAPEGVIEGYTDGTFGPNKTITREEAAAMVARLIVKLNVHTSDSELTFKDNAKISPWATQYLSKVISLGIIEGMPDGNFNPADNSTRAQAAVMILRMLEKAHLL